MQSELIYELESTSNIRCCICHHQTRPLLTLCDCSTYMHEHCIMQTITHQMQSSEQLLIPHCSICRTQYRASIQFCQKKFSCQIFLMRLMSLSGKQIAAWGMFAVGLPVLAYLLVGVVYQLALLVLFLFDYIFTGGALSWYLGNCSDLGVVHVFSHLIFPVFFARAGMSLGLDLWKDSMLQIVELRIYPKTVLKDVECD